mgnify:CR=1 FL=1
MERKASLWLNYALKNYIHLILKFFLVPGILLFSGNIAQAQNYDPSRKFEQLDHLLNTPNAYRTGSGAPGYKYFQQTADYDIKVSLDDDNQTIRGEETITYTNNSPDPLTYLWVQLDQNVRSQGADKYKTSTSSMSDEMSTKALKNLLGHNFDLGHKIMFVKDASGQPLPYTINKTMMRVDLPEVLRSGEKIKLQIGWWYNINDRLEVGGRSGKEYFEDDGNYLYTIAQWFPRMAVYDDLNGWQNKQFLGRGEFALPFGNYKVEITVPSDHIVASTGMLQNPGEVLSKKHLELYQKAANASKPVIIVSQDEVEKKEKKKASGTKTWIYHADSVRDFAWASSRKLIWDAMGVDIGGKKVMAMSYYPKEANPLYEQYSTKVVAHTLEVYSKFTIDYPYPVAISVEAANGMEYPMICFNYGRPEKDGTYSERLKYGMISVIIHEVGHNFFPMIINSDERQWTWMDEGLNTFCQFLAEQEWDENYPSRRGPAHKIVPYMKGGDEAMAPIMTNSEQIPQFGNNAYGKPATALNILRETVMGRELFDYAFKTYSERWAFKHPKPEDFFRTMEDASGVDLDWFWRGWFYTTDHVDIAIEEVNWYKPSTMDPRIENPLQKEIKEKENKHISQEYNKDLKKAIEQDPELKDFYNTYDEFEVTKTQMQQYKTFIASLDEDEKSIIEENYNFYEIKFKNLGGLVMPVILQLYYKDKTSEVIRIPAEIWRYNDEEVTKVIPTKKEVEFIHLDPYRETADTNEKNNFYPRRYVPTRFELYKRTAKPRGSSSGNNPMQKSRNR